MKICFVVWVKCSMKYVKIKIVLNEIKGSLDIKVFVVVIYFLDYVVIDINSFVRCCGFCKINRVFFVSDVEKDKCVGIWGGIIFWY